MFAISSYRNGLLQLLSHLQVCTFKAIIDIYDHCCQKVQQLGAFVLLLYRYKVNLLHGRIITVV